MGVPKCGFSTTYLILSFSWPTTEKCIAFIGIHSSAANTPFLGTQNPLQNHLQKGLENKGEMGGAINMFTLFLRISEGKDSRGGFGKFHEKWMNPPRIQSMRIGISNGLVGKFR